MSGKRSERSDCCFELRAIGLFLFVALVVLGWPSIGQSQVDVDTIDVVKKEDGVYFQECGKTILVYRHKTVSKDGKFSRANYVHPLMDLDGNVITEDFPDDHLHHRGIFWAWHQTKVDDQVAGDPWLTDQFAWDVSQIKIVESRDGRAELNVEVTWTSDKIVDENKKPLALVNEKTRITVFPKNDDVRIVDYYIRLVAAQDNVTIGGSDDDKGYGGFSARIKLPADVNFYTAGGKTTPTRLALNAGPWVNIVGSLGKENTRSGLTILCHPGKPNLPQPWILREKNSMQNAAFPGRKPVKLSRSKPLELMYRLLIHRGQLTAKQINSKCIEFAETDPE